MTTTRRVFISHTSEFTKFPEKKSFIDAAIAAVIRAKCLPCDMEYFTARDEKPAQYCIERVRECEVYVGVIGWRYGSPVRDRPEVSYTELEFEAASQAPTKKRLVFLLDPDSLVPGGRFFNSEHGAHQERFHLRLRNAGMTCKPFNNAHELEMLIFQALKEDAEEAGEPSTRRVLIPWPEDKSPYPGLLWFNEDYAPLFFGRDREVDELIGKMSEPQGRFLIMSGDSGSGKSSLVAAGLWRALVKEGRLPGSRHWRWLRMTPGAGKSGPFVKLAMTLEQAFPHMTVPMDKLAFALEHDHTAFRIHMTTLLTDGQELALFIDQLEELFTQGYPADVIRSFLARLVTISGDLRNRLRVVTTIRSDFFGRLAESESIRQSINEGSHYLVGPIAPTALQEMIQKPAYATGYTFESGLVDEMLKEAGKEPGSLPLVAYALNQLFEQRQDRIFTHAAYQAMGGVAGAIGSKADQVVKPLGGEAEAAFDRVFAELVHLERDRPPTRKRVPLTVFQHDASATQLIRTLAGRDYRILVTGGQAQVPMVEVAHEKLFTAWLRLNEWIAKSAEALRLIDHAGEAALRWQKGGDDPQELWFGTRAKEVLAALKRFGKNPSPVLERFLRPQDLLIKHLNQDALAHELRARIGRILNEFDDIRPGIGLRDGLPDIAWIEIAPGRIKIEHVDHVFEVKPFRMARYLVTNAQFEAFIKAEDGYRNEEWGKGMEKSDAADEPNWKEANSPREEVSWYEAVAFCRWLSHRTGSTIRLPTEWEWQQAATGGDPTRDYPWPGEWAPARCNSYESRLNRTTAVGMYPSGATQQGVLDMMGNLWEWCLNKYKDPVAPAALCIDDTDVARVVRGGFCGHAPEIFRHSPRGWQGTFVRADYIGFRLVQDIP